jgi:hypothetical protein
LASLNRFGSKQKNKANQIRASISPYFQDEGLHGHGKKMPRIVIATKNSGTKEINYSSNSFLPSQFPTSSLDTTILDCVVNACDSNTGRIDSSVDLGAKVYDLCLSLYPQKKIDFVFSLGSGEDNELQDKLLQERVYGARVSVSTSCARDEAHHKLKEILARINASRTYLNHAHSSEGGSHTFDICTRTPNLSTDPSQVLHSTTCPNFEIDDACSERIIIKSAHNKEYILNCTTHDSKYPEELHFWLSIHF